MTLTDTGVSEELVNTGLEILCDDMLAGNMTREPLKRAWRDTVRKIIESAAPRLKADGLKDGAIHLRANFGADPIILMAFDALMARADDLSPPVKETK